MKFSFLSFFYKLLKISPAEANDSTDKNDEETSEKEDNEEFEPKADSLEKNSSKDRTTSPLFHKLFIILMFCIILLVGVVVGLYFFSTNEIIRTEEQNPVIVQQEQIAETKYDALCPVSGDWGITVEELVVRVNMTLDKIGIRGHKIVNWGIPKSRKEFRHSFSPALSILGEYSDNHNVQRVALFFDPAFDVDIQDYSLEIFLIRALISAIDPSLTRKEIYSMIDSLGITLYERFPPRQAELRYRNFVFRVWSVAGSAYVITISADI